jgi:H+/gluconate symporter-like permease
MSGYAFELLGILLALALLIFLAYRGYTLLLAAPAAAIVAAAFSGEPLLAKWTLTFMQGTGRFVVNFFPLFLLGGVFGKLMDDSGAALSMARTITERIGETRFNASEYCRRFVAPACLVSTKPLVDTCSA